MALLPVLAAAPFWTLVLGGDVMLNAVAPSEAVWKGIAPVVRQADVALANLEIPLTDSRTPTKNKTAEEIRRRDQFILKASPAHARFLAGAGWDVVSLGNNHTMDYGYKGVLQQEALLRKFGVGYVGAGANSEMAQRPAVFTSAKGKRVAVLSAMAFMTGTALWKVSSATGSTPGVNGLNLGGVVNEAARLRLSEWIGAAKRQADFVVVAFHWGTERKTIPNPYQVALGRAAVDAGADVIWGHHPHVLQGAEIYQGKPIFYSLGNLVSPLPAETALARVSFDDSEMRSLEILPAYISGGKVAFLKDGARRAALTRFKGLCTALRKRFPHKESVVALR